VTSSRRALLGAAGLLVVLLVGGRALAIETAERTWAATFSGGSVLTEARTLARLLQGLVLLASITWTTGNVFVVYRAIGSVQLPRRLGDLEIVEAVPQPVLFGIALAAGLGGGVILAWDTGDWWLAAVLASAPPHLGVTDPILHRDLGYYLAVLPWHAMLQGQAMAMTASAATVAALLYAGMGSLRFEGQRLRASEHARAHLAVLLACLALVMVWGALLDSAEVVGGLHGGVDQAVLDVRLPGATVVAVVAGLTGVTSLVWGWRGGGKGTDRSNLLLGSWAALVIVATGAYIIGPALVRAAGSTDGPRLLQQRAPLERQAFGLVPLEERAPPSFRSVETGAERLPLWDAERVGSVAGVPEGAVVLWPAPPLPPSPPPQTGADGVAPTWLVAPAGERGTPRIALETDTGLALRVVPRADSIAWFGPGFTDVTTASPDTWPSVRGAAIALDGTWRRAALAWTLQAPELARAETDGVMLVWRRDVADRLGRLAPFAAFGVPEPALIGGGGSELWWISWGYVTSETFPLARALPWRGHSVRYARAGLLGAVRAATGETHVWLAPGYDSLTAAWARHFSPLIEPLEGLAAGLRAALPYPPELFALAAAQLVRASGDSNSWTLRPAPFEVVLGARWTGTAVESGPMHRVEGLLAGTVAPDGPRLWFWRAAETTRLPPDLVGSSETKPGRLRLWPVGDGGLILSAQAQFFQPAGGGSDASPSHPRLAQVYLSLGERMGQGGSVAAALRDLAVGGPRLALVDTSVAARWTRARALVVQADSALARGDIERFGRLYRELARLLAPPPHPR
jgi:uncharacterized membrane protein (UPF0182 family)